jgi:hypothetical protein
VQSNQNERVRPWTTDTSLRLALRPCGVVLDHDNGGSLGLPDMTISLMKDTCSHLWLERRFANVRDLDVGSRRQTCQELLRQLIINAANREKTEICRSKPLRRDATAAPPASRNRRFHGQLVPEL